jgi:NAD(P)-dependent dehydrogenase (short-subunit alcohol dehydrogenase family)
MRGAHRKNREAAEALRKLGIKTVELDVTDDASVEAGVKNVLAEAGKIDVLVNNAGIMSAGVTEAFTAEQAKVIFDTNVIGLLRVTRAVLPSMRQKRDRLIINIGSILGRVTFPFFGIYGASKMAVEALIDSLRYEVSQLGVEVVEVRAATRPTYSLAFRRPPAPTSRSPTARSAKSPTPCSRPSCRCSRVRTRRIRMTSRRPSLSSWVSPGGSRATRTVVGAAFGSDKANEDLAPVQANVVEALGLSYLRKDRLMSRFG